MSAALVKERKLIERAAKAKARRDNAKHYNVFLGSRLIQDVAIIPDGENVKLEGRKEHQRWTFRKSDITRKVLLNANQS